MRKFFLLLLIAALMIPFAAPAEGNGVITSGDSSYKLDQYDRATVLTMNGATDQDGLWLVPRMMDGHPVEQVRADCIPDDVYEILMPNGCFLRVRKMLAHEIRIYWYLDYEAIQELDGFYIPHNRVRPGELLLSGSAFLYRTNGDYDKLVQDYYAYPSEINGNRILINTDPKFISSYTCGPFTYYKTSPDTAAICSFSDQEALRVEVPESVDGLTVTALAPQYGWGHCIQAPQATEIVLPSTLTLLGDFAINAGELKSLTIPEGIEEIGECSVDAYDIKEIVLPSTLKRIGSAFLRCSVRNLVIPDSVTEICPNAFRDLELKSLTLPAGITEIPKKMCLGQEKLEKITIPDSVTVIRSEAFSGCKKLSKVTLPAGLREIGPLAFSGCKKMKQIKLGETVELIDPTAFQDGVKKLTIVAPEGSYAAAFAKEAGFKFKKAK